MTVSNYLSALSEARKRATPGNWWIEASGTRPLDYREIRGEVADEVDVRVALFAPHQEADSEFIALAANEWDKLIEIIRVQQEALHFYAKAEFVDVKDRYYTGNPEDPHVEVVQDDGAYARETLAKVEEMMK